MLKCTAQFSVELETISDNRDQDLIFAPALALFPSALARDAITFPLCNTNKITIEHLMANRGCAPENCYCAIFALDPFIDWEEFSGLLHKAKFRGICNFPSFPGFDEEETDALSASDYRYETELKRIKSYAGDQFKMLIVYSSDDQLELSRKMIDDGKAHYCHANRIADLPAS